MNAVLEFLFWFTVALLCRTLVDRAIAAPGTRRAVRNVRRWIRRRLGITSPSQSPEIRAKIQSARQDLVAAAIAEAAGHNWAADMMPGYRAEFRRQARAAIAAIHESAKRAAP